MEALDVFQLSVLGKETVKDFEDILLPFLSLLQV